MNAVCAQGHLNKIPSRLGVRLCDYRCRACGGALRAAKIVWCHECPPTQDGSPAVYVVEGAARVCPRGHALASNYVRSNGGKTP